MIIAFKSPSTNGLKHKRNVVRDHPAHPTTCILSFRNENTAMMTELVRAGANISSRDNMGQTPVFISARTGNLSGLKMLLDAGAEAWGHDARNVPLNHATLAGKTGVVRELVRRGGIKRWERGGVDALELAAHSEQHGNNGVVDGKGSWTMAKHSAPWRMAWGHLPSFFYSTRGNPTTGVPTSTTYRARRVGRL